MILKINYILRKFLEFDFRLIGAISIVSFIGFILMYSAAQGSIFPWAFRQVIHFLIGLGIIVFIAFIDINFWYKYAYFFYFISLALLILTEVAGHTAMGATRWLSLGFIKIQPSEPMKICIVLALARYFYNLHINNIRKVPFIIPPIIIVLVPTLLILKQPDLGTAFIILAIGGMMFFAAGIAIWKFGLVLATALVSAPIAWKMLHEYQRQRIVIFMNPEADKLSSGYNIIQSKISIGSGGIFGKGLINGSQTQLSFLPEHQTDFIFAMLSEELGFAGGMVVLILYAVIISNCYRIALNSRNYFGSLVTMGITCMFFLHVFINMAMVMGLIPVVGVPLPLLSYGGTIMITVMVGFGLIMCSKIHNDKFLKLSLN